MQMWTLSLLGRLRPGTPVSSPEACRSGCPGSNEGELAALHLDRLEHFKHLPAVCTPILMTFSGEREGGAAGGTGGGRTDSSPAWKAASTDVCSSRWQTAAEPPTGPLTPQGETRGKARPARLLWSHSLQRQRQPLCTQFARLPLPSQVSIQGESG